MIPRIKAAVFACRLIIPSSAWATRRGRAPAGPAIVSADHSFVSLGNAVNAAGETNGVEVSADHSFVSLGNQQSNELAANERLCRLIIPSSAWATRYPFAVRAVGTGVSADHSFVSLGNGPRHKPRDDDGLRARQRAPHEIGARTSFDRRYASLHPKGKPRLRSPRACRAPPATTVTLAQAKRQINCQRAAASRRQLDE